MSVDVSFENAFKKQLHNQQDLVAKHTYDDYMSSCAPVLNEEFLLRYFPTTPHHAKYKESVNPLVE